MKKNQTSKMKKKKKPAPCHQAMKLYMDKIALLNCFNNTIFC